MSLSDDNLPGPIRDWLEKLEVSRKHPSNISLQIIAMPEEIEEVIEKLKQILLKGYGSKVGLSTISIETLEKWKTQSELALQELEKQDLRVNDNGRLAASNSSKLFFTEVVVQRYLELKPQYVSETGDTNANPQTLRDWIAYTLQWDFLPDIIDAAPRGFISRAISNYLEEQKPL